MHSHVSGRSKIEIRKIRHEGPSVLRAFRLTRWHTATAHKAKVAPPLGALGAGSGLDPEAAKPLKDETSKKRLPRSREPLPLLGSNQDSPDPESGVLPVTPRGTGPANQTATDLEAVASMLSRYAEP